MDKKGTNRQRKHAGAAQGIKSDSMKSLNDSNANYDSSPQITEQKSVRQMVLHTHEKDRGDESDDQVMDSVDDEGHRYDPAGERYLRSRQTQSDEADTDSANLSNMNASVNEMEANDFQIDENTQNLSGIFQQLTKNKMQPNRTLMQGHMMPKSVADDRMDSTHKSQAVTEQQTGSPANGSSGVGTGFDLSEFGKLIMSQFNPFAVANSGTLPSESLAGNTAADQSEQATHEAQ
jgi:hypothetical protein